MFQLGMVILKGDCMGTLKSPWGCVTPILGISLLLCLISKADSDCLSLVGKQGVGS